MKATRALGDTLVTATSDDIVLPDFGATIDYILEHASRDPGTAPSSSDQPAASMSKLSFAAPTFARILVYLRHCLGYSAGVGIDELAHAEDTGMVGQRLMVIGMHLESTMTTDGLLKYARFIEQALVWILLPPSPHSFPAMVSGPPLSLFRSGAGGIGSQGGG